MKKSRDTTLALTTDYKRFVTDLKSRIASARLSAARHVNRELVTLYWDIGRGIVEKQKELNWGESVVEMVAAELRAAFPDMSGFSPRNLRDMKRFYLAYSSEAIWPQLVAKLENEGPKAKFLRQPVAEKASSTKWPQAVAKLGTAEPGSFLPQLVAEIAKTDAEHAL